MAYPRRYNIEGFILFDAICALALAGLMISAITYGSMAARESFERASIRELVIMTYREHRGDIPALLPGGSFYKEYPAASSTIGISASAKWYGNDRVETDVEASSTEITINWSAVRSYPFTSIGEMAGRSICSVEHRLPMSVKDIRLPLSTSLPLTAFQVRDGVAYLAIDSSNQSDIDLAIVDIADEGSPRLLSAVNTGPGLSDLALAGHYIYAAANSTAAQLHVIKADSPGSIMLTKKYQLPLPEASTSPPTGTAISYLDGKIYLGTSKWDGEEISVIDVANPDKPLKIGGFETGSKVNSIFAWNDTIYVTASDRYQFRRLNVQNDSPVLEYAFDPSGWQRQEGETVTAFEGDLGFGRTSGGFDISSDKEAFFWPESSSTLYEANVPGGVYGMVIDRSRIFSITRSPSQGVSVFDRKLSTTTDYYRLPVQPQAITCDLDKIYVLSKTSPEIYEISSI